jgi:hypothetical protein
VALGTRATVQEKLMMQGWGGVRVELELSVGYLHRMSTGRGMALQVL